MRPLGTPSLMAWAYVPISTFRFVEVKLLEEALATDSKLGTSEGFGVFSCSQDPSPPQPPGNYEYVKKQGSLWEKKNRNGFSNSRIRFPIAAGENQKSHEVQGLENAPENERRTASIRLLAT
jgi:hypothetical protein